VIRARNTGPLKEGIPPRGDIPIAVKIYYTLEGVGEYILTEVRAR